MKTVAIIPARGGSKRVIRKNVRDFLGKPMLDYAVQAALRSGLFGEIMVSTDDVEIAEIAVKCGAKVPFLRSEKNSDDHATTAEVLLEVIERYREIDVSFEQLCCIYPCVPFLTAETLVQAYREFQGHEALVPVCRYPVPIEWALRVENGGLYPHDSQALSIRSQDLVPKYHDVGMFYFTTSASLERTKTLIPPDTRAFFLDETQCQDIDTPEDWNLAEMKYRMIYG